MSNFSFDTINDFDNHISDSIFGYDVLHNLIINLSSYFLNEKTTIIDIGCTSGKLLNSLINKYNCLNSYGYDITDHNFIESKSNLIKKDITDSNFIIPKNDACYSVFTLQFIEPLKRIEVLRKIYESLNVGGFFIFCEKEYSKDGQINEMFTFVNYDYKKNKFSSEDILNKEKDLRKIMKPFNSNVNYALLVESGFTTIEPFFQSLNFKGYMQKVTENIFPIEWNLSDNLKVPYNGKKVFGTFVCGGGSTMGYKLAGYDHLGGVEFTEHYSNIYKHNHKPKYFYLEDIRNFNKRNDLPKELYNLDLLDGSPPCAAFSTAGAREKNWGKVKEYEGKQQVKDDLVYVYCDTIEKLKPKVFLLENVSGLAKGNAKVYLKKVVDRLSKEYEVQVFLLYAASMGIPQIRNRIFVIGHKKEFKLPKLVLNFECKQLGFEVTKKYWDILDENTFHKKINNLSIGKEWDNVNIGENSNKFFNLCKPHPKKPCFTITESSSSSAASVMHPTIKRKLNEKEVRMLCTFPKDYDFLDTNAISTMGRSVLPVMMANISNQIYLQWLSKI